MVRDGHVDGHNRVAAQRRRHSGFARLPVRRIRHDDNIGREFIAVSIQERSERRGADLLLALNENDNVDGQVFAKNRQRPQVNSHASTVIGGTTSVDAVPAHLSPVGIQAPAMQLPHRLDIVVSVQENSRRSLDVGRVSNQRGLTLRAILRVLTQDLSLKSQGSETLTQVLGAALHIGSVRGVRGHRRNSHQLGKFFEERGESGLEALSQNGCRQLM